MMRLRLFALLLGFLVSLPACAERVGSEAQAAKVAGQAVLRYRLTTLARDCFTLDVRDRKSYFEVAVREVHSPECGGAPEAEPKLFTMRVRKRDGRTTSDVYDGISFQPVDRPR